MKRTGQLTRRTPLARGGRLPAMSAKRKKEARIYSALRKEFLSNNRYCWAWIRLGNDTDFTLMREIWGDDWQRAQASEDVHHTAGRHGGNFLDVKTWMPVSRCAHDWITAHPKEAEARGWIVRTKSISLPDGSAKPTGPGEATMNAGREAISAAADMAHDIATESRSRQPRRTNFHE